MVMQSRAGLGMPANGAKIAPMTDKPANIAGKMRVTDGEKAQRSALTRAPKPRIAATIVLTCGPKDNLKILMGQRSKRHDFMPSVYVFPGGRVDRADSYAPYNGDLSARSERILEAAYNPRKARAVALAAVRETWEETGLMLGTPAQNTRNINHESYDDFRKAGQLPELGGIEVFGRAVTPPHRHKRFDTWFFLRHMGDIAPLPVHDSQELLGVDWFTFTQIEQLETQRATTMMLDVLKRYLSADKPPRDIFYSKAVHGQFKILRFPEI